MVSRSPEHSPPEARPILDRAGVYWLLGFFALLVADLCQMDATPLFIALFIFVSFVSRGARIAIARAFSPGKPTRAILRRRARLVWDALNVAISVYLITNLTKDDALQWAFYPITFLLLVIHEIEFAGKGLLERFGRAIQDNVLEFIAIADIVLEPK